MMSIICANVYVAITRINFVTIWHSAQRGISSLPKPAPFLVTHPFLRNPYPPGIRYVLLSNGNCEESPFFSIFNCDVILCYWLTGVDTLKIHEFEF